MVSGTTNTPAAAGINVRAMLDALPRFSVIATRERLRVFVKDGRRVSAASSPPAFSLAKRGWEKYAAAAAAAREIVERMHALLAARDARAAEDGRTLAPRTLAPPGALLLLDSTRPVHGPPAAA